MNTAFLLGAGASKDAGLPLADELTGKVLNGEFGRLDRANNPPDQPLDPKSTNRTVAQVILAFLRWIKVQIECAGTSDNHLPNYEDFAYVAVQIRDHLLGEFDNPAVHPLIQKALSELWPFLPRDLDPCLEQLRKIADATVKHISAVTRQAVSHGEGDLEYFRFLVKVPPWCNEGALNIFTLNNDVLVEQFLSTSKKSLIDGFDPPLPAAEGRWKPALFEQSAGADTIRLFKLHGSINWLRCRRPAKSRRDKFLRIGPHDPCAGVKPGIDPSEVPDGDSELLVGKFNKMLHYTSPLYLPLHYWFYRELERTDALIVCGYSFGDKGINQRIVDWMDSKPRRKMVVVSPDAKDGRKKARPAIGMRWEKWRQVGKLIPHESKVKSAKWRAVWNALR